MCWLLLSLQDLKTNVYPNLEGGEAYAFETILLNERHAITDMERAIGSLRKLQSSSHDEYPKKIA